MLISLFCLESDDNMKKFSLFIFSIFSFFLLSFSVDAKSYYYNLNFDPPDTSGIGTEYNDLLYQFVSNPNDNFIKFLISKGTLIGDYLYSLLPADLNQDLDWNVGVFSPQDTFLTQFDISVPADTENVFMYYTLNAPQNNGKFQLRTSDDKTYQVWINQNISGYFLFFNSKNEIIGYKDFYNSGGVGLSYDDKTFDRVFNLFYHVSEKITLAETRTKMLLKYVIYDGVTYYNQQFGNFFQDISNMFKENIDDFQGFDVNYYTENPICGSDISFKSIFDLILGADDVKIPDNFDPAYISDYKNGYYFSPLESEDCSDYNVYLINSAKMSLEFSFYNWSEDNKTINHVDSYYIPLNSPFRANYWNFWSLDTFGSVHEPKIDYVVHVKPNDTYNNLTFYYDPMCYRVSSSPDSNTSIGIYNDKIGGITQITDNDMISNDRKENDFIEDNYWRDENGNLIEKDPNDFGIPSNGGGFNFSLDTLSDTVKSFIGSVSAITSAFTVFMDTLPPIISSAFYSIFLIGIVGIVLKLLF